MKERIKKRGETSGRADDNDVTIEKRLKTFRDQTVPVSTHYGKLKKLHSVGYIAILPSLVIYSDMHSCRRSTQIARLKK